MIVRGRDGELLSFAPVPFGLGSGRTAEGGCPHMSTDPLSVYRGKGSFMLVARSPASSVENAHPLQERNGWVTLVLPSKGGPPIGRGDPKANQSVSSEK